MKIEEVIHTGPREESEEVPPDAIEDAELAEPSKFRREGADDRNWEHKSEDDVDDRGEDVFVFAGEVGGNRRNHRAN